MSIRIRWPKEGWPEEIHEAIRSGLEKVIRSAMAGASASPPPKPTPLPNKNNFNATLDSSSSNNKSKKNPNEETHNKINNHFEDDDEDDDDDNDETVPLLSTLIRGVVTIDRLSLGKVAPKIILKRILDLSPGRSGLLIHVEYKGDAFISLRGIELNLDPTRSFVAGGGGLSGGRQAEVVNPFFCPLTLTLNEFHICGDLKVEISHEQQIVENSNSQLRQDELEDSLASNNNIGKNTKSTTTTTTSFVPDTFTEMFLGKLGLTKNLGGTGKNSTGNYNNKPPISMNANKINKRNISGNEETNNSTTSGNNNNNNNNNSQIKRKLFIQLMSDEELLKDFNVVFPASQAIDVIKTVIRAATKQFFHQLRSQGITISL